MFGITSSTAKLQVGMTLEKINNSSASENVKKKQIELFNKYNTTPDDKIDEKEFAQYEKDCTKEKWMTGLKIAGGIALAGLTAFAVYKGIKYFQSAKDVAKAAENTAQNTATAVQGEHNAIAMVGDKATVVRADLVQANPTFTPHTPVAERVSTAVKGVEETTLAGSYVSKVGNAPIQEVRTQAYYDELGAEIEKGAEYFNPRTGNTIRYLGKSDDVILSKNGLDLMKLQNTSGGYIRQTRIQVDGKNHLHIRNSIVDYWGTDRKGVARWEEPSGHDGPLSFWRQAPASRTPAGSTLNVLTKLRYGHDTVRVTNSALHPGKVTVTFEDGHSFDTTLSELKDLGIYI